MGYRLLGWKSFFFWNVENNVRDVWILEICMFSCLYKEYWGKSCNWKLERNFLCLDGIFLKRFKVIVKIIKLYL